MCQLLCAQAAAATTLGWHWVLMGCDNQLPGPRRGCARRWKHLFPQCCVRVQCFPCSDAICVPNKCPHTTLQLLLAQAGRGCWHHIAATRKERLQYPPTCAVDGHLALGSFTPCISPRTPSVKELRPPWYLLINTANHFLQSENHCYMSQFQLLHIFQKLFSVEMALSELDSLHEVCSHAVLMGCWQQPAIRKGAYRKEDVLLQKRNRSLSSSEKPSHITVHI